VNSLFDLGRSLCRGEDIVSLRDHHRSHADIIGFSNDNFYEGRLRIATRYDRLRRPAGSEPAVRWVDAKGKVIRPADGGAVNDREARAVVDEVHQLIVSRGYRGTVGVVSPFRAHANRVRDLIQQNDDLANHLSSTDFLVDTVHRFQGDERDVMIFSPVVSEGISDSALGFLRSNRNLFNVAITRARAALVVVGDKQAALNSGVDYLARFAAYTDEARGRQIADIEELQRDLGPEYPPVSYPERVSDWERYFYRELYRAGVRPIPQYDVEQYTLEFAVVKGDSLLNIEVDGERYHRSWDGELCRRDQIRNQRLFELGWDVMRFWVYQIRDDLDACLARVKRRLDTQP
jgi:very-short-patch-repair endonuclease